jgi:hypothetical protein
MASLPQWPAFVAAFKDKRESWLTDCKGPAVYQNHAELVQTIARASECDDWITIFEEVSRKVHGPTDDTP